MPRGVKLETRTVANTGGSGTARTAGHLAEVTWERSPESATYAVHGVFRAFPGLVPTVLERLTRRAPLGGNGIGGRDRTVGEGVYSTSKAVMPRGATEMGKRASAPVALDATGRTRPSTLTSPGAACAASTTIG
ncbi:MAG: hypothetical protein JW940_33050 [Polyangiaceae bacterium]|nr:hypothetical protein [Polyangiaceae bacterium]